MLSNLVVISQYLREYQNSYANGYKYQYFYKETFEQNNIDVPVFDIIEEFTEKEYNGPIVATENLFDFFDVLFCEDNLDALKDSLILNIIYDISFINSDWDRYEDEEYENLNNVHALYKGIVEKGMYGEELPNHILFVSKGMDTQVYGVDKFGE